MAEMDENMKKGILSFFDSTINDVKLTDENAQTNLTRLGIEPNLETVLAYIFGVFTGISSSASIITYGEPRVVDVEGTLKLLEDRAWILREAILRSRYQ